MAPGRRPGAPLLDNPLLVLDLPAGFSAMELERAARKWLGMLELGAAAARTYATPAGPIERTADAVRAAAAALRDERRRADHEAWAAIARRAIAAASGEPRADRAGDSIDDRPAVAEAAAWPDALAAIGWGRR